MSVHRRQLLCRCHTCLLLRRSRAKPEQSCCSFRAIRSMFRSGPMMFSLSRLTSHTVAEKITGPETWSFVISIDVSSEGPLSDPKDPQEHGRTIPLADLGQALVGCRPSVSFLRMSKCDMALPTSTGSPIHLLHVLGSIQICPQRN